MSEIGPKNSVPPVAFLGVVEHHQLGAESRTGIYKTTLMGLKHDILSPIYPVSVEGFVFALHSETSRETGAFTIRLLHEDGTCENKIEVTFCTRTSGFSPVEFPSKASDPTADWVPLHPWSTVVLNDPSIGWIKRPGRYRLVFDDGSDEGLLVGQLNCHTYVPDALTPERIAAIRSDPNASSWVTFEMACRVCGQSLRTYAALERDRAKEEREDHIWYQALPESFACECGKTSINLASIRSNLHGLLGEHNHTLAKGGDISFLYDKARLDSLIGSFGRILQETSLPEEALQEFIEKNPVLLHMFTPQHLFFKSPILSLCKTDFLILNSQKELLLIEIEKPGTKILKKDGGVHSELQHAFDQVTDWLHICDDQRSAILYNLRIDPSRVGAVKGVVIAGRDSGYDKEHLRKLKGRDFGRIRMLTYDDLLAGLRALSRTFRSMR